jgi:hypothetical protein
MKLHLLRATALTLALVAALIGLGASFAGYFLPEALIEFANGLFLC